MARVYGEIALGRRINQLFLRWQPKHRRELSRWVRALAKGTPITMRMREAASDIYRLSEEGLEIAISQLDWEGFEGELIALLDQNIERVAGRAWAGEASGMGMRFDRISEDALLKIKLNAAERVVEISNETKLALRNRILESYRAGLPIVGEDYSISLQIRDLIGLTQRQEKAVDNYRKKLIAEGSRSLKRIEAMVSTYSREQLKWRCNNIARTESISASNAGQQAVWDRMGYATRGQEKEWILTPDDRLCKDCAAMDEVRAAVDGEFYSATLGISVPYPPLHPQCRCAMRLVDAE